MGIRHHDNPVTMDPGAPSGFDGTDVGWYDPTEGTTLTTNRPTDPDPHWEAVGFGIIDGGLPEITDFAVSGTGGITTPVNVQQVVDVEVSGVPGMQNTYPARPEITQFTISGQAAQSNARSEVWQLDFSGSCLLYTSPSPRDS